MPSDPQKTADTRAWLIKAEHDLAAAEQLLTHPEPLLDVVVHHCQQAGEKALKGYLFWHDVPFRKTHDLEELLAQCASRDASLVAWKQTAKLLTPLVSEFRYPSDVLEPPLDEAEQAFDRAKSLLEAILQRLPAEVAPAAKDSPAKSEGA